MCNQSFVYFSTVFAYESLALPLAALTIYIIASRAYARPQARLGLNLATVLGLLVVVITHHLTSYVLTVFLALWAIIVWLRSIVTSRLQIGQRNHRPTGYQETAHKINSYSELSVIGRTALLAFVIGVSWLIFVASLTLDYLAMPFWNALTSLVRFINGELASRILFQAGGYSAPGGERFVAYASVGLTVLMLPLGFYWIWKRYRAQNVALALTVVALIYPISLPFRLTNSGSLLSNRSIPFMFIAVAFVVAVGAVHLRHPRLSPSAQLTVLFTGATILFTGGVVLGWPESWRLPGPFLVSSHTRSIETHGIAAARWARAYLGPNNRMAADWINAHLMGSFGHQDIETGLIDGINIAPLFFSPSIGFSELEILKRGRIRYVVIDRRLSSMLPLTGWYVVELETNANHYESSIDPALLDKFDSLTQVSRLFDSGDIVIYDVGNLVNAP
jgi:hypothetical protein